MRYDYLIVGQGLAGSLLSYYLIKRNHKVLVLDDPLQQQASAAAAGIFNPFTGRKLVKTWLADTLFPFLLNFYQELQDDLQIELIHRIPMYRPFTSIEEQNDWAVKLFDDRYNPYIESIVDQGSALSQVVNPLGGIMLKKCGYVDITSLIQGVKKFLNQNQALKTDHFNRAELQFDNNGVCYQGDKAQRIVFCDGPWMRENGLFDWLPLRPVKGELLEIETEKPLDLIINRGVFILPIKRKLCRVGATFDNRDMQWHTTESARNKLQQGVEKLLRMKFIITKQLAGIRPASLDRRPLIGIHPEYEPLAVFNGLGTKGVSLAPYLIESFYEFLEQGKPMIPDVAISRYFSLYYNKI